MKINSVPVVKSCLRIPLAGGETSDTTAVS